MVETDWTVLSIIPGGGGGGGGENENPNCECASFPIDL